MFKESLKVVVFITIFLFLWFVFEWIYGFVIIAIAVMLKSYGLNFPVVIMYLLGFLISLVCAIFATRKLYKHRRVQAFINADGEKEDQTPNEKKD